MFIFHENVFIFRFLFPAFVLDPRSRSGLVTSTFKLQRRTAKFQTD